MSPGMESGYSQYLYAEGAYVTIINPYIYNLECHDPTWSFIATRQTGSSRVVIVNPYGIGANVLNKISASSTIRGLYVETPSVQEIRVIGNIQISNTFGDYAYSVSGISTTSDQTICNYTQRTMVIGQNSSFVFPATNISTVQLNGSTKELVFDAVSANVINFDQLLPSSGIFTINVTGTYSSSYDSAKLQIIETDGVTTNILASWTNSVGAINISAVKELAAQSGYSLYFRIKTNHTTDVMKFTNFVISHRSNVF